MILIIFLRFTNIKTIYYEEHINPISNFYAVKRFDNIFRVYCRILTPVLAITFLLGLISMDTQIFESGILEPYRSTFIEKKKKWILSFFIFVVIPFILAYMIFQQFIFSMMGAFIPVLFYGIYCLLLKAEVQRWLSRYDWVQSRLEAQKEKKELI